MTAEKEYDENIDTIVKETPEHVYLESLYPGSPRSKWEIQSKKKTMERREFKLSFKKLEVFSEPKRLGFGSSATRDIAEDHLPKQIKMRNELVSKYLSPVELEKQKSKTQALKKA